MKTVKPNKSRNKNHLIISIILLPILSLITQELGWTLVSMSYLEIFIGLPFFVVVFSTILASICVGISYLIKKKLSFINVFIVCCYFVSVLTVISRWP